MLNLMIFERMPKPGMAASRWVYLGNVYVLPAFRNAGIGGRLVETSIQFSQGIKAVRMVLSPSAESREFYARLGFRSAGELNILGF
jgi:predicted N-acetyltransferase YhbS